MAALSIEKIKNIRASFKLTRTELGALMGVSLGTIIRLEIGKQKATPSFEILFSLLFFGENPLLEALKKKEKKFDEIMRVKLEEMEKMREEYQKLRMIEFAKIRANEKERQRLFELSINQAIPASLPPPREIPVENESQRSSLS